MLRAKIECALGIAPSRLSESVCKGRDAVCRPLNLPAGGRDDRQNVFGPVVQLSDQTFLSLLSTPRFRHVVNQSGAVGPFAGVFAQQVVGPLGEMLAAVRMDLATDQLEGRSFRSLAAISPLLGYRSGGMDACQPSGNGVFTFGRADDLSRVA